MPENSKPTTPLQDPTQIRVQSPLSAIEIVAALEAAARRGKMAGFQRIPGTTPVQGVICTISDFGTPFESVLETTAAASSGGRGGTELSFSLRMQTKLIWVFGIVLVATVWPGVWLTDSMLRTYFSGYDFRTWMWYLPLTAPFVPLALLTAIARSKASAQIEALAIIERIRAVVGARADKAGDAGSGGGVA
ncbi:MAG: hypothetical protein K2W85_05710 [Phycisphaerales bacterium]|nr:hypothetical protein [Phycisphaerales bacterium]